MYPSVLITALDVCLAIWPNNGKLPKTAREILYNPHLEMSKIMFSKRYLSELWLKDINKYPDDNTAAP